MTASFSVVDGLAMGAMGAWFGVSVLGQLPFAVTKRLRVRDIGGMIPFWSFFAPKPGTVDFHLLYRDQFPDGAMTDWVEVPLCDSRRSLHVVWNPRKREKKALFDLTVALLKEAQTTDSNLIQLSVPYLVLVTFVSGLEHLPQAAFTQFLLMMSHGSLSDRDLDVLFTSAVHPL